MAIPSSEQAMIRLLTKICSSLEGIERSVAFHALSDIPEQVDPKYDLAKKIVMCYLMDGWTGVEREIDNEHSVHIPITVEDSETDECAEPTHSDNRQKIRVVRGQYTIRREP